MTRAVPLTLPSPATQADRLVALGLHEHAGLAAAELRAAAAGCPSDALLVLAPDRVPASALVPAVRWRDRPAFVVVDLTDLDDFTPLADAVPPPGPSTPCATPTAVTGTATAPRTRRCRGSARPAGRRSPRPRG